MNNNGNNSNWVRIVIMKVIINNINTFIQAFYLTIVKISLSNKSSNTYFQ